MKGETAEKRTPLDRLLDDLMTNALGQEAERLVLMGKGKKDLGGWSRQGLRAAILRVLPEIEAKR